MTIEEVIKSTVKMDNAKKVILNIMYTQNVIQDHFNELIKPYDLSGEQYNVLRILRGQKGNPANMDSVLSEIILRDERDLQREISPLLKTKDAIEIDTDTLSISDAVDNITHLFSLKSQTS